MRQTLQQLLQRASIPSLPPTLLPVAFLAASTSATLAIPLRHSLLISAVAWSLIAAAYGYKLRGSIASADSKRWRLSSCAGLLYALAQLCERAPADRHGLWWTHCLLPAFIYLIFRLELPTTHDGHATSPIYANGNGNADHAKAIPTVSNKLLLTATITSGFVLSAVWISPPSVALGLCSTLLTAASYLLLEHTFRVYRSDRKVLNSVESLARRPRSLSIRDQKNVETIIRDTAAAIGVACLICSLFVESYRNDGMTPHNPTMYSVMGSHWRSWQPGWQISRDVVGVMVELIRAGILQVFIQRKGAFHVSLLGLAGTVLAQLLASPSLAGVWLGSLFGIASSLLLDDAYPIRIFTTLRARGRARQIVSALTAITVFAFMASKIGNHTFNYTPVRPEFPMELPLEAFGPREIVDKTTHPIDQLVRNGEDLLQDKVAQQSSSLREATAEYRRRYQIAPPPNFDMWYEFARRRDVILIDEFDAIHDMFIPFWALPAKTIRNRLSEAIGFGGNFLITVMIREGAIVKFEGGADWQQKAMLAMLAGFVHYLPDMDLAFNAHDEPRVIVPHDTLSHMVKVAQEEKLPAAAAHLEPRNMFSARPADMTNGKRIEEFKTTRFNVFAHQPTWTHSRSSCPPDSPARSLEEGAKDNVTSYAITDLGFVYNHTAFYDICQSPSLSGTFGFFDRPNAYNIIQELIPVFSQSKISSYQDLIYPSPWYWANMVEYNSTRDLDWDDKNETLYWRGSTTGGFSRDGGWRRQHRQRVVRLFNEPGNAKIMMRNDGPQQHAATEDAATATAWQSSTVHRQDFSPLTDVRFSHVGQCDPGDCDAQKEFFHVTDRVDQQDAWNYKHLLDVDGNAFSGRFYAFLKSNSLVYKINLFVEWHRDWLVPWAHYIPLTLKGDDWLEAVRWFSSEVEGRDQAKRLAKQSTEWAHKALRNEDFEVWFFRLLLEYGRIIDDQRETIGYPGP